MGVQWWRWEGTGAGTGWSVRCVGMRGCIMSSGPASSGDTLQSLTWPFHSVPYLGLRDTLSIVMRGLILGVTF